MSALGYLAGAGAVLIVVVSAACVGVAGRRALVPAWSGALSALSALVLADLFLVLEGEILGSVGLFSRVPLVVVAAGSAVIAIRLAPAGRVPGSTRRPPPPIHLLHVIAGVCSALVLAQGVVAVRSTLHTGNLFIDALDYHLTVAANFATSHHTTGLLQLAPGSPVSYYPFNDELLHGMAIALFGRDTLSMLLGIADVAAMLLAAWCVGSVVGRGALTLCAVCPVLSVYGPIEASAMNDWAAVWPLVAAVAIAVRLRDDADDGAAASATGPMVVAGVAIGLAIGTKLSSLAAALALMAACIYLVPRSARLRASVAGCVAAAFAGGYWYVRDVVQVGSPLPSQHIPGFPRVPMPLITKYGYSVAHYLTDGSVIHDFFRPGLQGFFGPFWWLVLIAVVLGIAMALRFGSAADRAIAVVGVLSVIAYLVTPTGAIGREGAPYLFQINLRYAIPAVTICLLLLARSRMAARWPCTTAFVFVAPLVANLNRQLAWGAPMKVVIGVVVAMVTVTACVVGTVRASLGRSQLALLSAGCVIAVVAVGYPFNHTYLKDRYAPTADPLGALYAALHDQSGVRVGVVGLPGLYPYLGPTYANQVEYLGKTLAHHEFADYTTCESWRAAVSAAHVDYVVIEASQGSPVPPALEWTASDAAATPVVRNTAGAVFAIGASFAQQPCATAV